MTTSLESQLNEISYLLAALNAIIYLLVALIILVVAVFITVFIKLNSIDFSLKWLSIATPERLDLCYYFAKSQGWLREEENPPKKLGSPQVDPNIPTEIYIHLDKHGEDTESFKEALTPEKPRANQKLFSSSSTVATRTTRESFS